MYKLFKVFFNKPLDVDYNDNEFDYNFKENSSIDLFNIEFRKFLYLDSQLFYHDNRILTIINSYEVHIKKKILKYIFKLYIFAKKNNLTYEKTIIIEFLYTYFKTINSIEYKQKYKHYSDAKREFKSILENLKITQEFFNDDLNLICDFYKELINYAIGKSLYINNDLLDRIFNNLSSVREEIYNELVDLLVSHNINISTIIKYDNNIKKNKKYYLEYIYKSLSNYGGYNYYQKVILKLNNSSALTKTSTNKIINKLIDIVNEVCRKFCVKKSSILEVISKIDDLKKDLLFLLQNISSLNTTQKNKIKECLSYLLRLKRYLLSDENYINSEMHEISSTQVIPKEQIEETKKAIKNNKYAIYSLSKVNFSKAVGEALKFYSEHPLQSSITNIRFDSNNLSYSINVEENSPSQNSNFKKYYDKIGKNYTLKHKSLVNKLTENYYEELLKYLSKTFILQQNLIIFILKDDFKKLIKDLKKDVPYNSKSDYSMVVGNILAIEADVLKLLEINKSKTSTDGYNNLNLLFTCYEDEKIKDGIMYINYILYEKSGLNLRNKMMHGTLINTNLDMALLVTFVGLIFISVLINETQKA